MTTTYIARLPPSPPGLPLFTAADRAAARRFFADRPTLEPTPLEPLPALARSIGLGALHVKDESSRFGLNAFKLLGARFAIESLLADGTIRRGDTLACASEGNHGRAVARTAKEVGCAARVYLSGAVTPARAEAIASEGATIQRVAGTYDDAVRQMARDAEAQGWTVVSDTSWEGYTRIPHLIMLGYTRMVDEIAEALTPATRPDAIFVPAGVGGLLAAVAVAAHDAWTPAPRVIAVEPASAACLQASARAGRATPVPGPFTTDMGGLRCGEVSPLAFDGARAHVDSYIGIDDGWAERALRRLARPLEGDRALKAGLSGAATLGGLFAVLDDPAAAPLRQHLNLGASSTVVVIASEGVTDPDAWRAAMGRA